MIWSRAGLASIHKVLLPSKFYGNLPTGFGFWYVLCTIGNSDPSGGTKGKVMVSLNNQNVSYGVHDLYHTWPVVFKINRIENCLKTFRWGRLCDMTRSFKTATKWPLWWYGIVYCFHDSFLSSKCWMDQLTNKLISKSEVILSLQKSDSFLYRIRWNSEQGGWSLTLVQMYY